VQDPVDGVRDLLVAAVVSLAPSALTAALRSIVAPGTT
jgi:hypothetical protein